MQSSNDPLSFSFGSSFNELQGQIMAQKGYLDELDVSVEFDGSTDGTEVQFQLIEQVVNTFPDENSKRIVAANNVNDIVLLAHGKLARLWSEHAADAFAAFERQEGRPAAIGGLNIWGPRWLEELGISRDRVETVQSGGPKFIQNQIDNEKMDGVFADAPEPTELSRLDVSLDQVAWIGDALAAQPDGVTVMTEELWKDRPALAKSILEKHVKATEFLTENPGEAAAILADTTETSHSETFYRAALGHRTANFVTDPRPIMDETNTIIERKARYDIVESYPVEDVFHPALYDEIT